MRSPTEVRGASPISRTMIEWARDMRPARVFLSHAWIDRSNSRRDENARRGLVHLLRDALRREGLDVFYDEDDLQELDDIDQRIRAGLSGSTLFVCCYSDAYRERRACNWEL